MFRLGTLEFASLLATTVTALAHPHSQSSAYYKRQCTATHIPTLKPDLPRWQFAIRLSSRPDAVTRCVTPTDALSHRACDGSESDRRLQ
jgi:hypothetical protein